jgi:hypothetical protein
MGSSEFTRFAVLANRLPLENLKNLVIAMRTGGRTAVTLARAVIEPVIVLPDGVIRRNRLGYSASQYNWKLHSHTVWERKTEHGTETVLTKNTVMEGDSVFSLQSRKKYEGMFFRVEHPSPFDIRHCLTICVPRYNRVYSHTKLLSDLSLLHAPVLLDLPGLFHKHCRCFLIPVDRNGNELFEDDKRADHYDHGDINARLMKVMETMAYEVMPVLLREAFHNTVGVMSGK